MKKSLRYSVFTFLFTLAAFFSYQLLHPSDPNKIYGDVRDTRDREEDEHEGYDGARERAQWEYEMIKDPATGKVPYEEMLQAVEYTNRFRTSISFDPNTLLWTERGPDYDQVGSYNGNGRPGNGYTSGRMRAIWADLADATKKTVWVGGISGGLWKTSDITASPATWSIINDQMENMAVSSICQDPTNTDVMYLGTGEKTYNIDAVRGGGIWKSTDHGVTWTRLSSTTGFYNISKIACDASGNVYVAGIGNNVGLRRSTDGGATWTEITPTGLSRNITDFDISNTGALHVVGGYYNTAIQYRYTTTPATVATGGWITPVTNFTTGTQYNCDITSSGNTVYALPSNASHQTPVIYKSTDGGANWAATVSAPVGTGYNALSNGQGWYCLALAVDQSNPNNVLVGGLNTYRSLDGGVTWTQASVWVAGISATVTNYIHADQQEAYWDGNRVLVASDGGIFYSDNGGLTFNDRNRGLRLKQFYSCAVHPTNTNYILAGAQDNGVHQLKNAGLSFSTEVTGGDGAFVDISNVNGNLQFGSYVFNEYYRSTDGGTAWSNVYFSNTGQFINPFDYDEQTNAIYACYGSNSLMRWDSPASTATATTFTVTGLGNPSAVLASPYTAGTLYTGSTSGKLFKITGANSASGSADAAATNIGGASFPAGNISCVNLGTSENTMVVVFSNYSVNNIWYTTDGGANWSAVDGNLPNMPVRWALFPPGVNDKLIIATEAGVYTSSVLNGASTAWTPSVGFPTVRTDMLKIRTSDNMIVAATHGRGIWTSTVMATLPLRNLTLKGTLDATGLASLAWTSLDAGTKCRFHVQFSKDGINFQDVAELPFNSQGYQHRMPVAQGYYRVVGAEPNVAPVISNTVLLRNQSVKKGLALLLAPNPVQSQATLVVGGAEAGSFQWQITSSAGQVLKRGTGYAQQNASISVPVQVTSLPAGTYWLRVIQGRNVASASFIKN